jgi:iron complex outermembrane receptor protein
MGSRAGTEPGLENALPAFSRHFDKPRARLPLAWALTLAAGISPTAGQVPQRTAPTSAADQIGLTEVRVTARRREERLLDVPDSITALSSTTVERARIRSVKDVAPFVPNFSIVDAQQPGVAHINVRGVGQTRNSEPPVAVVIDGVQISDAYQVTQNLFDIERIEVLKGPQGAVYGRNALGGAINITTRAPTNELTGAMRAGVGSASDYTASGTLSGALTPDVLLFRVGGQARSFGGDVSSPNTPGRTKANELDDRGARLALLAKPSEKTTFDLRISHNFTESGAPWYALVPAGTSGDEPRDYDSDFPSHASRALTDVAAKAALQLDGIQLASVTSWSKVTTRVDTETDFTPADGLSAEQRLGAEHWSQELRASSSETAMLRWLAGLYYLNTHQRLDTRVLMRRDFLAGMGLPPALSPMQVASTSAVDSNDAWAGFGQASYRWPANIELTVALRYDEDRRHQLDRGAPVPQVYEATFSAWQPKVSFSWFATPASMVYVTAGKGFRSGGFNPQDRITRIYRAETNVSEEIGTKLSMLDNRVNLTAALFHTRIDDRQVYTLDVLNSAQTLSNPIPRSSVRGVELEVTARPIPALEIGAAAGFTRSRIERYDPSVFAGLPVAGDFTGNSLPQTPEYSWALQSQYRMSLRHGIALIPRVEWLGQAGDFFWEIDNVDRRRAQSLLNLRLIAEREAWTVSAYLENATNERYVLEFLPSRWSGIPAGDIAAAARGRHGGVEATWRF